jgi:cyanophycinase
MRLAVCVLLIVAAQVARPADPPPLDPRGLPGPLVVAGGGKLPADVREAFFTLAGKEKARIVVIPTASIDADDEKQAAGFTKQWEDLKAASVTILHTRDKKKADDADFVKPLAEATGVWFSGGDQNRLTATYRGTRVETELKKLHARGGVIGGTSAGAAVMTDLMIAGGDKVAETAAGFGFLTGYVVDQHFLARKRQGRLEGVIAANPGRVGLGLDEGTAIVIRGRVARVIGDSTLTVCAPKPGGKGTSLEEFKAGSLVDLVQYQRAALNRVAKDPFPPKKPADPVVPKGALMIVGGGGAGPDIWKKFIELCGGPDATIVVVTTAMEDPLAPVSTEERALKANGAKNVVALHTRDRKEADDPKFSEVLTKAGGVWFSGGRQWRFVDSYEGTLTLKRFHEVLARGGAIGGSSAGASIQSEYMPRGHPLGNTVVAAEGYERGFGFLPGCAVDQHFFARKRTEDMTGLMKEYPQYLGIGIDEGTAIVVTGSVAAVMGKSKVAFYDARKKPADGKDYEEVFPNGKYDLKERKPLGAEGKR